MELRPSIETTISSPEELIGRDVRRVSDRDIEAAKIASGADGVCVTFAGTTP